MFLKNLTLLNYKNLDRVLNFQPDLNLILAPNGTGKTNVIEAINYLATGKSFRYIPDSQVFPYDRVENIDFTTIKAKVATPVQAGADELKIVWKLDSDGSNRNEFTKTYFHNNKKTNLTKFKHLISTLVHAPDTMDLVSGTASVRRDFIDDSIKLLNSRHKSLLKNYKRVVRSRSSLLENFSGTKSELKQQIDFWDRKLIQAAAEITRARIEFLETALPLAEKIAREIYHIPEVELGFKLDSKFTDYVYSQTTISSFDENNYAESIQEKLNSDGFEKEYRAQRTLYGAHRDDYIFTLEGNHLRYAASRGQQRLYSLVIHLALQDLLEAEKDMKLILLLDDILSELDLEHKQKTLDYLLKLTTSVNRQIVLTSADPNDFGSKFLSRADVNQLEIEG